MIRFNFLFFEGSHGQNRYLGSERDVSILMRGAHLILKLARSESQLEFRDGNSDKSDYFWIGDQDPDKVYFPC